MTDVSVGPLSAEEARIQSAADEAYRVLERDEPAPADATTVSRNLACAHPRGAVAGARGRVSPRCDAEAPAIGQIFAACNKE